MRINTSELTDTINQCFDFSMDGQLSPSLRQTFLAEGKRLRGQLLNLLTATFDEGTPAVLAANDKLDAVNQQLSNSSAVLDNAAAVLNNIAGLVSSLDRLLGIAAAFL